MSAKGDMNGKDEVVVPVDLEDFSALSGETVEQKITSAIEGDVVVVFGRSTCPYVVMLFVCCIIVVMLLYVCLFAVMLFVCLL